MARSKRDVMIIDWAKCMRVPTEDTRFAQPSVPYRCPVCATQGRSLTPITNSGRLRFGNEATPICEDHEPAVQMVPV